MSNDRPDKSDANTANRLIDLAEQSGNLDQSCSSTSDALSDEEKRQLDRLKAALDFIHQVRDDQLEQAKETAANRNEPTIDALASAPDNPFPVAESGRPTKVARFEVIRLLGSGGFAKVYLARDPLLDRHVALKILRTSLFFSKEATVRFDREAKAAAVLNHPNIVPVFETGVTETDWFIASGYCEGMTLQRWMEQRTERDPMIAAKIMITLANAVEHAHQRGIIHRDLKPANILTSSAIDVKAKPIAPLDPERLQIADFGLAKFIESTDLAQTNEGTIVGTPAYMSPEQAKGEQEVGHACDIYSLGVILYELLTGKLPLLGKTNIETLLAITKLDPIHPRTIDRGISRDLEAICLKCLNKSPIDRYPSAYELGEDLRRWLTGRPVVARPVTRSVRLGRWCKRNPTLTTAFAGISAALVVALIQWRSAIQQNQRADRHLTMAQDVIVENGLGSRLRPGSSVPVANHDDAAGR